MLFWPAIVDKMFIVQQSFDTCYLEFHLAKHLNTKSRTVHEAEQATLLIYHASEVLSVLANSRLLSFFGCNVQ